VPGLQAEQAIAPAEGMKVPKAQLVHVALFELPWKVPGPQLTQAASPGPEYMPAAQPVHMTRLTAPSKTTKRPPGHFVQAAAPDVSTYIPAGHLVHVVALVALVYVPAGQAAQLETPTVF
jgi:hypothetical protein